MDVDKEMPLKKITVFLKNTVLWTWMGLFEPGHADLRAQVQAQSCRWDLWRALPVAVQKTKDLHGLY